MNKKYEKFKEPILIVDDEKELRYLLAEIVEELGLTTIIAASALEGLESLKNIRETKKDLPCLILSDFKMPEMNGVQFCTEIKKLHPDLPFIIITGHLDTEVAVSALQTGIADIIEKPFQPQKIQNLVQKYINARIDSIETEIRETEEITTLFVEEAVVLFEDLEKFILRLEEEPLDPTVIDTIFRAVHSVKGGAASLPNGKWLAQLGHSFESCLSAIKKGKVQPDSSNMELFLLTSDLCQKLIQLIKVKEEPSSELIQTIEVCIKSLNNITAGEERANKQKATNQKTSLSLSALTNPTTNTRIDQKELSSENEGVWVSNEKLDSFMKLSGELIVLKNYFQVLNLEPEMKELSARVSGKLTDFSCSLNKITDNLQDQIMSVRKITLERALSKLPRIFRQVTKEVNKKVKLITEGFDLGVDRTIANALSTCMTHMLRNALDHGIESTEKRSENGKPIEGTIAISAKEQKGVIYLTISDDGGGIDPQRVISKAIEKGLIEKSRSLLLSDSDAYDLLFLPGFSTAEKVTGISGRGVGMDVVKSEIIKLMGKIKIESHIKKGTTFYIEIPVPKTVMVEQTILVKTKAINMAIPLNAIAQLTSCSALTITTVGHQKTCQFQGKTIPLKTYDDFENQQTEQKDDAFSETSPVVMLQHKNEYLGLLVNGIYDQLEAVIRPFDKVIKSFPGFKGTTVLGDDNIAYVVAPDEFVSLGLGLNLNKAA